MRLKRVRGGTSAKMRTRSRIHLATDEGQQGNQRQSLQRNFLIFGMPFYCSVRFYLSWLSHPLYYFSPAEAHKLSAVLWPKWLERDRQIDPHNLTRVIKSCTVFEKGDDESWYCNSRAIQRVSKRQACRCCWGEGGREGRGERGRTMANV
jgi:hypothetical protein